MRCLPSRVSVCDRIGGCGASRGDCLETQDEIGVLLVLYHQVSQRSYYVAACLSHVFGNCCRVWDPRIV